MISELYGEGEATLLYDLRTSTPAGTQRTAEHFRLAAGKIASIILLFLFISGTAFYSDRYARTGDGWRIAHTGYVRVFEEHRTHSTLASISFRSRFES